MSSTLKAPQEAIGVRACREPFDVEAHPWDWDDACTNQLTAAWWCCRPFRYSLSILLCIERETQEGRQQHHAAVGLYEHHAMCREDTVVLCICR
jgi:hypothetical protein